jgi:acetyl-CoA synthetase
VACVDRWPAEAPALLVEVGGERFNEISFGTVKHLSDRFGNALLAQGVRPGGRVAVILPQGLETAVAHTAAFKIGAVTVPMSVLFGYEALQHRLSDSGAAIVVTDRERLERVEQAARDLDATVIVTGDEATPPHLAFETLIAEASDALVPAMTAADAPALIIYTSGTTGSPKGALHAHRVLLGHQPGFQLSHDRFPQAGDRFWTPADWAWIGGLMNGLFSSWYHGRPIAAAVRAGFDPEWAVAVIGSAGVRNVFLPPTALRMMRAADVQVPAGKLRTVMSGGEVLGKETHAGPRRRSASV